MEAIGCDVMVIVILTLFGNVEKNWLKFGRYDILIERSTCGNLYVTSYDLGVALDLTYVLWHIRNRHYKVSCHAIYFMQFQFLFVKLHCKQLVEFLKHSILLLNQYFKSYVSTVSIIIYFWEQYVCYPPPPLYICVIEAEMFDGLHFLSHGSNTKVIQNVKH